ncbi:hypothetical protein ACFL1T_02375 [Chlamydiota bacterium]
MIRSDQLLFSESNSRFIVEISPDKKQQFENLLKNIPFGLIGKVRRDTSFIVYDDSGKNIIKKDIYDLKESWQKTLRDI